MTRSRSLQSFMTPPGRRDAVSSLGLWFGSQFLDPKMKDEGSGNGRFSSFASPRCAATSRHPDEARSVGLGKIWRDLASLIQPSAPPDVIIGRLLMQK